MKKIILLFALISCQTMAYPTYMSEAYPLDKKELNIQKNDETDVIDTFKYNKNLNDITEKNKQYKNVTINLYVLKCRKNEYMIHPTIITIDVNSFKER